MRNLLFSLFAIGVAAVAAMTATTAMLNTPVHPATEVMSQNMQAEQPPKGFGFSDTAFRVFILMASRRLQSDRFLTVDYRPEIYTMGHRSSMGLTVNPSTGEVWLAEMGPNGGDEINVLKPGRNYGWPAVSLGRTYPGPWQARVAEPTHAGYEPPVVYWMPSISVSGLTFYTGDALPRWKGDLFVGGLRYGEVPGTGRLDRILFSDRMEELRRESLLGELHQRIRDVKQGPDGLLYIATDEPSGAILRIEPAGP